MTSTCDRSDVHFRVSHPGMPGGLFERLRLWTGSLALAGQAGARLAYRLGLLASGSTMLRQVRRRPQRTLTSAPRVLGIDDTLVDIWRPESSQQNPEGHHPKPPGASVWVTGIGFERLVICDATSSGNSRCTGLGRSCCDTRKASRTKVGTLPSSITCLGLRERAHHGYRAMI